MNYYNEIKKELIDNELTKKAKDYSKNKSDLEHYYNVGKLIVEAQGGEKRAKYGDNLIKEYSMRLTIDLGKGYSTRTLKLMRKFYLFQKGQALPAQLTWSHCIELLFLKNANEIQYYIDITIKQNLSYRQLHQRIKLNEYDRLDIKTKEKLIKKEEMVVTDFIKNPVIIKNSLNIQNISEKYLKRLILEDIVSFMHELGDGFSFINSEYKIKIGNNFNYIDLLLFNIKYNCYCVIELKVTRLNKEHLGQIMLYMSYVDKHIKSIYHDKTIGIIICKRDNKLVLEYCSDPRIFGVEYELV